VAETERAVVAMVDNMATTQMNATIASRDAEVNATAILAIVVPSNSSEPRAPGSV